MALGVHSRKRRVVRVAGRSPPDLIGGDCGQCASRSAEARGALRVSGRSLVFIEEGVVCDE
jgi:hypothetical protein